MSNPTLIADLDARVVKRVLPFAAVNDVRANLCGIHAVPGVKAECKAARVEATNGHMLYAEEDKSAVVERPVIVRLSPPARAFLKAGCRLKVYDNATVQVTDAHGAALYIEPGVGIVSGAFPQLGGLIGLTIDWHEGLRAPINTEYLRTALALPGSIRFFSRKDANGQFSLSSSVMFVMDGGTPTGGKAMGIIMPMRSRFDSTSGVADMLPESMLATRAVAARAA